MMCNRCHGCYYDYRSQWHDYCEDCSYRDEAVCYCGVNDHPPCSVCEGSKWTEERQDDGPVDEATNDGPVDEATNDPYDVDNWWK